MLNPFRVQDVKNMHRKAKTVYLTDYQISYVKVLVKLENSNFSNEIQKMINKRIDKSFWNKQQLDDLISSIEK